MKGSRFTGDALADDASVAVYQNTHGFSESQMG
jgi:hypothetical protein